MGHIKKRMLKDGSASYQARIPSPNNPRKDIVKTFALKKDAETWLTNQAAAMNRGDFIAPSTRTFKDLSDTWWQTRGNGLAPKTRERYDGILRNYLLPAFGSMPLSRINRPLVKQFFADLDTSAATAKKVQITLSSILSEAVELGLIRENPAAKLRISAGPRREMVILTADEVRRVADAMPTPADSLAVYMAAYTGLRAGELWALQRKHIDLAGDRLTVERTLTNFRGKLIFKGTTKTEGSRRTVSLPTFLVNRLAEHLKGTPADALVFTGSRGAAIHHNLFVRRVFRPAVLAALPVEKQAVRWHDLRHTCASILIGSGASVIAVAKRLGHAKPSMTLDIYLHLFPSEEAALAGRLDAIFSESNVVSIERAA